MSIPEPCAHCGKARREPTDVLAPAEDPSVLTTALSRRDVLRLMTAAGVAAGVAVAGVTAPPIAALPSRQEDETLAFLLRDEPRSLDPAFAYDFVANPVVCQITEGLLMFDAFGEVQPLLAERWDHPDPLTYRYTLRSGVTFHDGSPLTTEDVVASLNRIRDPELGSPMAWMYGAVDTITATGDREVTIALKRPWTLFRYVPATAAAHIVPAALIAAGDDTLDLAPVGTGPYRFASWEPGKIGLNRHDGYWQDGVPFFAEVVFEAVDSDDDRIGRLDEISIGGLTPDFLTEAQFTSIPTTGDPDGGSDISVLETTGHFSLFVALRCDTAPFADAELRRAFARAIDTDAVVAATIGPTGVCGVNSTVPPNVLAPCSNAGRLKPVSHDPKKAREVVKRVAPGGFSTTLTVLDEEPWREIGKAIAAQIEQTLGDQDQGVRVTVQRLQYHDYQLRVRLSDYDGMLLATWAPDFPDASANLRPLFHSGGQPVAPNLFRYSNPEVDRLLDLAHQGDDVQDRCSQLIKAQRLIAADQPYVLIDHLKWFLPLVGNLSGYTFGPLWFWDAFLRTLTRSTGGEPRVSSPTPEDCDKYLSELILWNGSLAKRTVELSAIVVHPSGKTGVMKGTFAESAATVDGRIGIETTASWYDDPATRTEWTNPDTKVHVAISTTTDDKQGRVEVALEDVGAPTLSLRLIRCDAGPLAAAGFVPGSGETEEAIYLLSFLKDGPPPIPIIH